MCGIMGYFGDGKELHQRMNMALFSEISQRGIHAAGYFADGEVVKAPISSSKLAMAPQDVHGLLRRQGDYGSRPFRHPRLMAQPAEQSSAPGRPVHINPQRGHFHQAGGDSLDSECDSEILVKVIQRSGGVGRAFNELCNLAGSFAFLCWDGAALWFARNEGSPGVYVEKEGAVFVASTEQILKRAARWARFKIGEVKEFESYTLYKFFALRSVFEVRLCCISAVHRVSKIGT
jgi:asparagine synthetase B (glutamine-hydrolysing)